ATRARPSVDLAASLKVPLRFRKNSGWISKQLLTFSDHENFKFSNFQANFRAAGGLKKPSRQDLLSLHVFLNRPSPEEEVTATPMEAPQVIPNCCTSKSPNAATAAVLPAPYSTIHLRVDAGDAEPSPYVKHEPSTEVLAFFLVVSSVWCANVYRS